VEASGGYTRLTSSGGPELERTFSVLQGRPRRELLFDADLIWVPAHAKMRLGGSITHFDLYVAAGAGVVDSALSGDLAGNAGLGLKFFLGRAVAIRVDVRDHLFRQQLLARSVFVNDLTTTLGLSVFLPVGSDARRAAAAVAGDRPDPARGGGEAGRPRRHPRADRPPLQRPPQRPRRATRAETTRQRRRRAGGQRHGPPSPKPRPRRRPAAQARRGPRRPHRDEGSAASSLRTCAGSREAARRLRSPARRAYRARARAQIVQEGSTPRSWR
jgi:outer membrane beta-barrel protein